MEPAFLKPSGFKSVFKKLRFCDGLVWTVGLTVKVKASLQIPPAEWGRDLSYQSNPPTNAQKQDGI